jgi:hypothetical protein
VLDLFEELASVLAALDDFSVDYALCGGLAMAVWGVPRATIDIDLLIQPKLLDRALDAVRPLGYVIRARPMDFADGAISIRRVSKVDAASGDTLMLDLMLVTSAIEDVWAGREALRWERGTITVVSKEGLVKLKTFRSSGRDLDDIALLRSSQ